MEFIRWILNNFGLIFGPVFMVYLFLMIRRLTILYDLLRLVPKGENATPFAAGNTGALAFLDRLFERLAGAVDSGTASVEPVIDVIWSEVDCRISVHFTALNGYVNTIILIGFAGTIFGSIGAFNEMFQGLAMGEAASAVFVASWNSGLATALYTSLGAAAIGGIMLTLLCSRFLMTRAKRLETMVGMRISEIIEEKQTCHAETEDLASALKKHRIQGKTFLPTSSC